MRLTELNESINREIRERNSALRANEPKPKLRPAGTRDNPTRGRMVGEEIRTRMKKPTTSWFMNEIIGVDAAKKSGDVFRVARGFFYRHGGTPEAFADKISKELDKMGVEYEILDSGEIYGTGFKGGASTWRQDHWWVDLRILSDKVPYSELVEMSEGDEGSIETYVAINALSGQQEQEDEAYAPALGAVIDHLEDCDSSITWDDMTGVIDKVFDDMRNRRSPFDLGSPSDELAFGDILDVIAETFEEYGDPLRGWSDDVRNYEQSLGEEKKKGVDGKACWKGHRLAGKEQKADGTYKDICVPAKGVKEQELMELDPNPASDKTFEFKGTHGQYEIYVKRFNQGFLAIAYNPASSSRFAAATGENRPTAIENLKAKISEEEANLPKITGKATVDFNVMFTREFLDDPAEPFWVKLGQGPTLIFPSRAYENDEEMLRADGFKRASVRSSKDSESATPIHAVGLGPQEVARLELVANGRYVVDTSSPSSDRDGNQVYPLVFHSTVAASDDRQRLNKPALTVASQRGMQEGWSQLPNMPERYTERDGLEGPFMTLSGKVVYYDPREGSYYDPDTDMYMDYEEFRAHNEA